MVIMNDLESPMLSYCVIYYEKFKKVLQWTEMEALMYLRTLELLSTEKSNATEAILSIVIYQ